MASTDLFYSLPRAGQSENLRVEGHQQPQHIDSTAKKRHFLRRFNQRCSLLLTRAHQDYLIVILKEYQRQHRVEKLVARLRVLLDTPAKLELLREIRHFIASADLPLFDRMVAVRHVAQALNLSSPRPKKPNRARVVKSAHGTPQLQSKLIHGYTEVFADESAPLQGINLVRENGEALGFSIRGGSEHGLGIFVSDVEMESAADRAGLDPGDNIMEVNNVSFDNIAASSAATVLTGSRRLKMIVRKLQKLPGLKSAREVVSWCDVEDGVIIKGDLVDYGSFHSPLGRSSEGRRLVDMSHGSGRPSSLGFNIRGGVEYGLGLYVSKIDEGSLAEERGLDVGDEILEINGHSCLNVTHTKAVYMIQSHNQLQLSVRSIGLYPAFKEIFAEYKWTDTLTGKVTRTRTYQKQLFGT